VCAHRLRRDLTESGRAARFVTCSKLNRVYFLLFPFLLENAVMLVLDIYLQISKNVLYTSNKKIILITKENIITQNLSEKSNLDNTY
jgi:hypothetical protein